MFECRQDIEHSSKSQAAGRPDHLLKFPGLEEIITSPTRENSKSSSRYLFPLSKTSWATCTRACQSGTANEEEA